MDLHQRASSTANADDHDVSSVMGGSWKDRLGITVPDDFIAESELLDAEINVAPSASE